MSCTLNFVTYMTMHLINSYFNQVNIGQDEDFDVARKKATSLGAIKVRNEKGRAKERNRNKNVAYQTF